MSCSEGDGDIVAEGNTGSQLPGTTTCMCGTAVTQETATCSHQEQGHTSNDAQEAQYDASSDTHPNHGTTTEMAMRTHDSQPDQTHGNGNGRPKATGNPGYIAINKDTDTEMSNDTKLEATKHSTQNAILNKTDPKTVSILQKLKVDLQKARSHIRFYPIILHPYSESIHELFSRGIQSLSSEQMGTVMSILNTQEMERSFMSVVRKTQSTNQKGMALLQELPLSEEERKEVMNEMEQTNQEIIKVLRGSFMD